MEKPSTKRDRDLVNPKKQIEDYMRLTGLRAYQVADLAKVPRVSIYRYLKGKRDLKLSQWHSVEKLISKT